MKNVPNRRASILYLLSMILPCFTSSAFAWDYLDVPGTECKAQDPLLETELFYKHYGEIRNVSDEMIKVVCGFQFASKEKDFYKKYGAYVYGTGLSDEWRDIECKLWITNSHSGSRRSTRGWHVTKKGHRYRLNVPDVKTKQDGMGSDIITLECFMDPDTTIQGIRLFSSK